MPSIASPMRTAAEMSRRRSGLNHAVETGPVPEITVTSAAFPMQDECMMGSLMGDGGEVVELRLHPSVVNEMTQSHAARCARPPGAWLTLLRSRAVSRRARRRGRGP